MIIFVKTIIGISIALQVEHSTTIYELKCMIQEKEGIPPDPQRLFVSGSLLLDDRTLEDYGVTDQSNIFLALRRISSLPCLVPFPEPAKQIKPFIQIEGASSKRQYIVDEPFTVNSLMEMIQTTEGIPMDRQGLSFNGAELKEFSTLVECGLKDGDIIVVAKLRKKWWKF